MDDKRAYIPDVSSFFSDGKKHSAKDILNRVPIEQESVTFGANDMYVGETDLINLNNVRQRVCRYRKKRKIRKFNTNFKRS